jgi:hypothetical protein
MPKLVIEIDHEFQAGPMLAKNDGLGFKTLSAKELKAMIAGADPGEFGLNVCLLDPDEGWPFVGFEMYSKGLKKGGVFEFTIDENEGRAKVRVQGEIASSALRAGVAPMIQKLGKKAEFRLTAFNFRGNQYSGFEAPIQGQKEDDFKNWFKIKNWKLK